MISARQLQAETSSWPELLDLWISGTKWTEEVLDVVMVRFVAVTGNCCFAVRSLIVFVIMLGSVEVRSLSSNFFLKRGIGKLLSAENCLCAFLYSSLLSAIPEKGGTIWCHDWREACFFRLSFFFHHCLMKNLEANRPCGGSPFRLSNLNCLECIFVRGVRVKTWTNNFPALANPN